LRKDDPSDPSKKTYPWGNPSAGYGVYDRGGHFSLMISQNPPLAIPAGPFSVAGPITSLAGSVRLLPGKHPMNC
jgi:hypothetical protein